MINVNLSVNKLTIADLKRLTAFPQLRGLCLFSSPITDEGMKNSPSYPKLQELYLRDNPITDEGYIPGRP